MQNDPEVEEFISGLNEEQIGVEDINISNEQGVKLEVEQEEEDVVVINTLAMKERQSRLSNYKVDGDVALCYAWMNVSLHTTVSKYQSKDMFWAWIKKYYRSTMKIESLRTKNSLTYR